MKILYLFLLLLPYVFSQYFPFINYLLPQFNSEFTEHKSVSFNNLESSVNPNKLLLYIYTRSNPDGDQINLSNANIITEISSFKTNLKTVFFIHGWLDSYTAHQDIREALLEAEDVNVIYVNWDEYSSSLIFLPSLKYTKRVGKYLGEFLMTLWQTYDYSLDNVTIVGHSLGAHLAGQIGKATNGTLGIIIGLDPARLFFFKNLREYRLTETDAKFVEVIHTGAQLVGINNKIGRVDFWPNGGYSQPGCKNDESVLCSHARVLEYYIESIKRNDFFGIKCSSYEEYLSGNCSENDRVEMGGVFVDKLGEGDYYLETNSKPPYGKG